MEVRAGFPFILYKHQGFKSKSKPPIQTTEKVVVIQGLGIVCDLFDYYLTTVDGCESSVSHHRNETLLVFTGNRIIPGFRRCLMLPSLGVQAQVFVPFKDTYIPRREQPV